MGVKATQDHFEKKTLVKNAIGRLHAGICESEALKE